MVMTVGGTTGHLFKRVTEAAGFGLGGFGGRAVPARGNPIFGMRHRDAFMTNGTALAWVVADLAGLKVDRPGRLAVHHAPAPRRQLDMAEPNFFHVLFQLDPVKLVVADIAFYRGDAPALFIGSDDGSAVRADKLAALPVAAPTTVSHRHVICVA